MSVHNGGRSGSFHSGSPTSYTCVWVVWKLGTMQVLSHAGVPLRPSSLSLRKTVVTRSFTSGPSGPPSPCFLDPKLPFLLVRDPFPPHLALPHRVCSRFCNLLFCASTTPAPRNPLWTAFGRPRLVSNTPPPTLVNLWSSPPSVPDTPEDRVSRNRLRSLLRLPRP